MEITREIINKQSTNQKMKNYLKTLNKKTKDMNIIEDII